MWNDRVARDQLELVALHRHGEHDLGFEQSKLFTDALAWAAPERKISKFGALT